jgi:hypothetical protein
MIAFIQYCWVFHWRSFSDLHRTDFSSMGISTYEGNSIADVIRKDLPQMIL